MLNRRVEAPDPATVGRQARSENDSSAGGPAETTESGTSAVRKKIALQVVASNFNLAIHFVLTLVLARLLTPEDIGIFSMSAVLIGIAHVFRDFGVTAYIKRVRVLDDQTIRTARTVLVIASWSVGLLMYLSAGLWASFFKDPRVAEVVVVLAMGFLLIPLGAVAASILSREVQVVRTAAVSLVSALVYFAVSVGFALNGYDHMTMAWANFVNIAFSGIALNAVLKRKLPWKPSLKGWRNVVSFGAGNMLASLVEEINLAIPEVALGRLSSATAVGLYSRANATVGLTERLLQPPINYFTLPYMAKVHHADGHVGEVFVRLSSIIQCLAFPALAWIAIMAPNIIVTLYGAQWLPAAAAVPWLCVAAGLSIWFALTTPTLNGVGKPYAALWPLGVIVLGKIAGVFLLFDGTLAGFAFAMAMGEVLAVPVYLWTLNRYARVNVGNWARLSAKALAMMVPLNTALYLLLQALPVDWPAPMSLLVTLSVTVGLHAALYLGVKLPIGEEARILAKNLRLRRAS